MTGNMRDSEFGFVTAGDTRLRIANVSEQTDKKHVWTFVVCDAVDGIVNDGG